MSDRFDPTFRQGDRVRVKRTRQLGKVTRHYVGDTYFVMLDGEKQATIFAHSEIERYSDE